LSSLCSPLSAVTTRRQLRAATQGDLDYPRTRTVTYGSRPFALSGPTCWNLLQSSLKSPSLKPAHFWATVSKTVRPMLSDHSVSCPSVCPVLSVTLVYCGQTAGWIKMKLCMQVGLGPGHNVRWRPSSPPQKWGGAPPQFSAHVHCGQTAGWIEAALGTEMGLGPDHSVLDEDPAPSPKGGGAPSRQFSAHFYVPNGWMHQDATWYEVGLSPGDFVLDGDHPAPSPKRGGAPNFLPMSIVAKRLDGSRCQLVRR